MVSVTRRRGRAAEAPAAAVMEERLLAALERLLEEDANITAVPVERLAREAGISRATFYLHFRDKSDLIERLIYRVEEDVIAAGGMWFEHAEDASYADLRAAISHFVDIYREHRAILIAAAETAAYDNDVDVVYQRMIGRFRSESARAVQRIASHGRAHAKLPPMLADVLSWSTDYCLVKFGTALNGPELEALIDALTHIVWHAIFAEPPA